MAWKVTTSWHVDNTTCEMEGDWTVVLRTHTTVEQRMYLSPYEGPIPEPAPPTVTEFQIVPPVDPSEGLPPVPPTFDPMDGGLDPVENDEEPMPEYHPTDWEDWVDEEAPVLAVSAPHHNGSMRSLERVVTPEDYSGNNKRDESEEDPSEYESSFYGSSRISGPRVNIENWSEKVGRRYVPSRGARDWFSL